MAEEEAQEYPFRHMTPEEIREMYQHTDNGEHGNDTHFKCSIEPHDHIHATRIGPVGGDNISRVLIASHNGFGGIVSVNLPAGAARSLALTLLDISEEVDGEKFEIPESGDVPDDISTLDDGGSNE